jgi:tetratricopeptide (TPR) repeat protein
VDRIGKYEGLEKIGRGAMGVVYKGYDPFLERPVAIKMMAADFEGEPELLNRFFREARVAVQLKHLNIIDVHDLAEEDGRAYIVMELLDGEDLKEKLKRREYLPLERRLEIMLDLCSALAYAHEREVVHRDLKPGNIQITASGRVKVLDFGLARIADSEMTATGMVMGTPSYMSPEQLEGEKVDERSDIFALGSVFYELLAYRKAFEGRTLAEAFAKIAREDPAPLHELNPAIPESLSAIIQKALRKGRADRYQSAATMGADLKAVQETLPELRHQMRAAAEGAIEKLERLKEGNADLLSRVAAEDDDATVRVESPALDDTFPAPGASGINDAGDYLDLYRARHVAEVEHEQLQGLLSKLEPLVPYLEQDLRRISDDDLAGVVAEVDALVEEYSSNARAVELQARVAGEQERRQRAVKAYTAAKEARETGELQKAGELASEILDEDSKHIDAQQLAVEVEEELERRERERRELEERQRRIGELLEKAESLRAAGDLAVAKEAVGDALQLDEGHEAALQLEQQLDAAIEEAVERQQRLAKTYAMAVEARQAGELEKAAELTAQLLDEEPAHTEAAELATEVKAEIERLEQERLEQERLEQERLEQERLEHEERRKRIGELLEKAESLRAAGDLEDARKAADEALQLEEGHARAKKLRGTLDREIKKLRAREKRITRALAAAIKTRQAGELEKAAELAAQVLEEEPEHAEAKQLIAEVEAEVERREEERRAEEERERKEAERLAAEKREAERREAEKREAEKREAEKREAEKRAAEKREAEKREAERLEAEKREAERLEAEKREAEKREAEKREAEKREAEKRAAEKRAAEKRKAEKREAEKREAERREAALTDTVEIEPEATKEATEQTSGVAAWQRVPEELLATVRDRPALLLLPLAAIVLATGLALWPTGPDSGDEDTSGAGGGETSGPAVPGGGATVPGGGTSGTTTAPLDFTQELAAARRQLEGDDFDAALATVDGVLQQQPDNAEAQRLQQQANQLLVEVRGREARDHLTAGRSDDALAAAQAVLAVDPGNEEAQQVQQAVLGGLGAVQGHLTEARSHLEAGRYQQAAASARAALDAEAGNQEARSLLARAGEGSAMDRARSQASEARRNAQEAGAPDAASQTWRAAVQLQDDADSLAAQGSWSDAAARYDSARARFVTASEEAATEIEAATSALRTAAETARANYTERQQQLQISSQVWEGTDFMSADRRAEQARVASAGGDYAGARSGWEDARELLSQTARQALANKRSGIADQERALEQQALAAPVPSAAAQIATADAEESSDNLLAAARALDAALSHYREAAAILAVLEQYRQAFENKSMAGIRQVWPGVVGTTSEDSIEGAFRGSQVSLEIQSISTSIDLSASEPPVAEHVWTVRYRIDSTTTPTTRQRIELRKQDGEWIIQSMDTA